MLPKVDVSILIAKRDSTIVALYKLSEEFQVLYKVQPVLRTLENVYKDMEIKYRSVKIQQETITDRLIETGSKDELLKSGFAKISTRRGNSQKMTWPQTPTE